jgi:hypothetical protein
MEAARRRRHRQGHRERVFAVFARYKKAAAKTEITMLALINKAAQKQWQAAAWYLERKRPENWARQARGEEMTEEKFDAYIAKLDRELGQEEAELRRKKFEREHNEEDHAEKNGR